MRETGKKRILVVTQQGKIKRDEKKKRKTATKEECEHHRVQKKK